MKCYFFEFIFDSFKIPQISKHVFLLRSTFVIEDFDEYSILVFKLWFLTFFGPKARGFACILSPKIPYSRPPPKDGRFSSIFFDPNVRP